MKPDPNPERVDAEALLRDFDDALRASEADPRLFAIIEHDVERLARERDEALEVLAEWVGMVERDEKIRTRHLNAARAVLARYRKEAAR